MLSLSVFGQEYGFGSLQLDQLTENMLHTRNVPTKYSNSIKRVGISNHPPSRYQSVAWLESNDTRVRSRKPYRASSIGT